MSFQVFQGTCLAYKYLGGSFICKHKSVVAWGAKNPLNPIVKGEENHPIQTAGLGGLGFVTGTWSTSKFGCKKKQCF